MLQRPPSGARIPSEPPPREGASLDSDPTGSGPRTPDPSLRREVLIGIKRATCPLRVGIGGTTGPRTATTWSTR